MRIRDTTLGELSEGPAETHTTEQYLEAGRALDRLGVSSLGVGHPGTGSIEVETIRQLSSDLTTDVVVTANAGDDLERALATDPDVVAVRAPVSDPWLEHLFGGSREEAFDAAEETILRVREHGIETQITLTDAFRAEIPAIAGAFGRFGCSIVLADSTGARTPPFVAGFLRTLADASADLTRAGVRFRDDLGCGTANSIIAVETGIDRVDTSVAGLGRRAGATATEELIVATATAGGDPGVEPAETIPVCDDVLRALDESVPDRKPVLGTNATTHLPGSETDAALADSRSFESFDPAEFGGRRRLLFGEETGRDGARRLIERAGGTPDDDAVEALLERLADAGPIDLDGALDIAAEV